jgi:hypothetical protein
VTFAMIVEIVAKFPRVEWLKLACMPNRPGNLGSNPRRKFLLNEKYGMMEALSVVFNASTTSTILTVSMILFALGTSSFVKLAATRISIRHAYPFTGT